MTASLTSWISARFSSQAKSSIYGASSRAKFALSAPRLYQTLGPKLIWKVAPKRWCALHPLEVLTTPTCHSHQDCRANVQPVGALHFVVAAQSVRLQKVRRGASPEERSGQMSESVSAESPT